MTSMRISLISWLTPFLVAATVSGPLSSAPVSAAQARPARIVSAGSVQERAAQEAEATANDLAAVATRLEALAKEASLAARDARGKAIAAQRRAAVARKSADLLNPKGAARKPELGDVPGSILRAAEEREAARGRSQQGSRQGAGARTGTLTGTLTGARSSDLQPRLAPPADDEVPVNRGIPTETDKHAAAKRTSQQNKAAYYKLQRAKHDGGAPKTLREETMTFSPDNAPDLADLEIRGKWQWSINVARGSASFQGKQADRLNKTGNLDYAGLLIGPAAKTADHGGMKWGMRRFNLGDSTVVDCDFEEIPLEHGIYDNLAGHGIYKGNTFHHLGGQAIQIAHRDFAYAQYKADNLPFRGKPVLICEDNHAADCGRHASKSGFTWTFFDYGSHEFPSTLVMRNCTSVHSWDFTRTMGGQTVKAGDPGAIRSPGGMVVHQYQHAKEQKPGEAVTYANEFVVLDNCLFDHTQNLNPVVAIRGTETILIEDSCFIARSSERPFVCIDDVEGRPSGRVILENCVSPPNAEVFLTIRGKQVMSMNCPGERIEIDVATLKVTRGPMQDDAITKMQSPLTYRRPPSGVTPQPLGHIDDLAQREAKRARAAGQGR